MSAGEIVIILIVALLVFGPQKLPELARTLGKLFYELRKGVNEITAELGTGLRDMDNKKQERDITSYLPKELKDKGRESGSDK